MKRVLMLFNFILLAGVLDAQVQITQTDVSNFFTVDKSWKRFLTENSLTTMNVGTEGSTSQNWIVPAFSWTDTVIITNLLPVNTPYASTFPTATNAQYSTQTDGGDISTSYRFYKITSNALYSVGSVSHYQTSQYDTTIISTEEEYILQLPLTYGTTFGVTRDSTDLGGGTYIINSSSQTVDAFGTIGFPWNSYGTLRVNATNGTEIYLGGILFSQSAETYFSWITKDGGIFEAEPDSGSGISGTINLSYASLTQIVNATPVENENNFPEDFVLFQNYPNPFNPVTLIKYNVPYPTNVSIKVFDVLGNEIALLVNENKSAGGYEVTFNASNLSSGIYFYKLITGNVTQSKKMILMK